MDNFGIVSVPVIVVLCLLIGKAWKTSARLDDKWIPCVCGASGLILGVVGRTIIDGFPATDPITAAAIGVCSGLSATGAHQIYKQLTKGGEDK